MAKVIIDQNMTNIFFSDIVFREAENLAAEIGLNYIEIKEELSNAPTMKDVKIVLRKYFGDSLKLITN